MQVFPAEELIPGGVPAEVEEAGLGVVEMSVAGFLVVEVLLQVAGERRDLGAVLQLGFEQGADGLGRRGREIGVIAKDGHHDPLVEQSEDFLLRRLVAERGEGAVEVFIAVVSGTLNRGFAVLVLAD